MADIFDQLAGSHAPTAPAAAPAPAQQAQQSNQSVQAAPSGTPAQGEANDIFSQLAAGGSGNVNDTGANNAGTGTSELPKVSAQPGSMPGNSVASKVGLFADNLRSDLLYGGERTEIGRLLKAAGALPLVHGQGEDVGRFFGSPCWGPLESLKAVRSLPSPGSDPTE